MSGHYIPIDIVDQLTPGGLRATEGTAMSAQEEHAAHLVGAGGWRACDTAADWAGSDTTAPQEEQE